MKNIYLLPTDNPSRLWIWMDELRLGNLTHQSKLLKISNQNLYITNNEKFVRDEYITDGIEVIKASPKLVNAQGLVNRRNWKKIILTTDFRLAPDVQSIDDEFLEWFVKNPSYEEVEIDSWSDDLDGIWLKKYKIIIPKEEQKQHLIDMVKKDEELGLYDIENDWDKILEEYYDQPKLNFISLNKWLKENYEIPKKKMETKQEIKLEDIFNDEKTQGVKELIDKHKQDDENYLDSFGVTKTQFEVYRNFNKQETLEELADKWVFETNGHKWSNNNNEAGDNFGSFIAGFKEAEKTLYSEEEVFELCKQFATFIQQKRPSYKKQLEWFELNKKK